MLVRKRYIVKGRVQGVGFRQFTAEKARALEISGWVRNLPDGSVELEAEADSAVLDHLEQVLLRGPALSRVEALVKNEASGGALPAVFEIRR